MAGLVSAPREQAKRAGYRNENTTAISSSKVTVSNQKKNPGPLGTLGGSYSNSILNQYNVKSFGKVARQK